MEIKIVRDSISKAELQQMAQEIFGDFVKAAVDTEKEIAAFGGELHADEEAILLGEGSRQEDVWGINLYPQKSPEEWIEFNSMINIRPSQRNFSRGVEDQKTKEKILKVINKLIAP